MHQIGPRSRVRVKYSNRGRLKNSRFVQRSILESCLLLKLQLFYLLETFALAFSRLVRPGREVRVH